MCKQRKIIHIDMDAFFAAVEQRDFPEYRGKPIIVGGAPDTRGVVATCSYEARPFGVHSAMPSAHAYKLCPQAIFVKPRFDAYRQASTQIREIFAQFTELLEPLSLDEAYLDVSDNESHQGSATLIAREIKKSIRQKTKLTASAGISYNKFLAKIASDMDKPDGLYLIRPHEGAAFAAQLPVKKFHGIGKATSKKMHDLGIYTGNDLKNCTPEFLKQHFGKAASHYYDIARGIDHRLVNTDRPNKSIGVETTYQKDLSNRQEILQQLQTLFKTALVKVHAKNLIAYTLTVKVKYDDFEQITRSKTFLQNLSTISNIKPLLEELINKTEIGHRRVRLLGITLSSLVDRASNSVEKQLDIFDLFSKNCE